MGRIARGSKVRVSSIDPIPDSVFQAKYKDKSTGRIIKSLKAERSYRIAAYRGRTGTVVDARGTIFSVLIDKLDSRDTFSFTELALI